METSYFNVAAGDVTISYDFKTEIPREKALLRAELAQAMAGQPVTICAPAPHNPRMAFRGEWIGDQFFPESTQARLDKDEVEAKAKKESRVLNRHRRYLKRRQDVGNDRTPANDNREPMSWPLLAKLRRDGRHDDAEFVEAYRSLVALMECDPLQGQDVSRSDGMSVEERSTITDDDVDKAHQAEWPSDTVKGGDLVPKGVRQLTKSCGTTARKKPANDNAIDIVQSMAVKFNETTLIAQIDCKGWIPRLHSAMGPLVQPFEDAALGGMTMAEVGESRGFSGKPAEAVGKSLVYTAIDAARVEFESIKAEQRRAEAQADRNVLRRRAELAAERASFLGRAA